jgi:hypothetical protein
VLASYGVSLGVHGNAEGRLFGVSALAAPRRWAERVGVGRGVNDLSAIRSDENSRVDCPVSHARVHRAICGCRNLGLIDAIVMTAGIVTIIELRWALSARLSDFEYLRYEDVAFESIESLPGANRTRICLTYKLNSTCSGLYRNVSLFAPMCSFTLAALVIDLVKIIDLCTSSSPKFMHPLPNGSR